MMNYKNNFQEIEKYSKNLWDNLDVYKVKIDKTKKKKVVLDFFPYPSGVGLHIGHTLGYIATDIYSRFNRLKGYNVLHAMGYDAFGLPAEQFAIENNEHPSIITYKNIDNIKAQLKNLGLDHDESRTFNTTDSDYYKWTQFIFIKLYNSYFDEEEKKAKPIEILIEKLKKQNKSQEEIDLIVKENRLAYLGEVKVNWCPKLGTVLSNEEIIGGLSERGSHPVFLKPLKQWVLRITKYAERLVENLEKLNWPLSVKEMQKNWIGISNGHEVTFNCSNNESLIVYTTRLETLSGVTFLALSKEHSNILKFFSKNQLKEIENEDIFNGIKSNITAINPITNKKISIFIADYVLAYGTCAVMSVPSNDERDYAFAKKNNIEILPVICPDNEYLSNNKITIEEYKLNTQNYPCYSKYNDLLNKNTIIQEKEILEQQSFVEKKTYTRLRDWIFSRQRYWGEPFPIILDKEGNPYALEESALPIELPYLDKIKKELVGDEVYKPLDDCLEWKNVKFIKINESTARIITCEKEELIAKELGKEIFDGTRETNTMPNWAGSCWYYLRYMDNHNNNEFIGKEAKEYWATSEELGCVDLYLGGAEHAVLHLLYARFWHMVLYDLNYVNSKEPFQRLFNQGMIQGPSYQNEQGKYFSYKDIEKRGGSWFSKNTNELLIQNIGKIGKRYKNGVTPEEICNEYSIDALRLFMMYLGPLEQSKPWDYSSIKGMVRVLEKLNDLKFNKEHKDSDKTKYEFNLMLEKIEKDFESLKFNTAIAAFIIFLNKLEIVSLDMYEKLIIILSPIAPHLCEYLYQTNIKSDKSIVNEKWPTLYENLKYKYEIIPLVISLNGKKMKEMSVKSNITKEEIILIIENYCKENEIVFNKIIVPSTLRNAFFANIVKKN